MRLGESWPPEKSPARCGRGAATANIWTGYVYYANGQLHYSGPLADGAVAALVTYGTIPSCTSDFVRSHCWTYNYNVENEDFEQNGLPRWYDERTDPLSHTTQFYKDDLGSVVCTLYPDDTHTRTIYGNFDEFAETLTEAGIGALDDFPEAPFDGWMTVEFAQHDTRRGPGRDRVPLRPCGQSGGRLDARRRG